MNKILRVSAAAGAILLTGALVSCAKAGTKPDGGTKVTPTSAATTQAAPAKPRALGELPKKKAPAVKRPVDVESVPWDGTFDRNDEIQEFRIVVDEVWRYCLVNAKGGMACFDSSDAP